MKILLVGLFFMSASTSAFASDETVCWPAIRSGGIDVDVFISRGKETTLYSHYEGKYDGSQTNQDKFATFKEALRDENFLRASGVCTVYVPACKVIVGNGIDSSGNTEVYATLNLSRYDQVQSGEDPFKGQDSYRSEDMPKDLSVQDEVKYLSDFQNQVTVHGICNQSL